MEKAQGIRGHNSLLDREAAAFLPHVYNAAGERVICPDPTLKAPSGPWPWVLSEGAGAGGKTQETGLGASSSLFSSRKQLLMPETPLSPPPRPQ